MGIGFQSFPFILQQIRDQINFMSTRNLIFSLCRWNEKLAENIVLAIFQAIQKQPDVRHILIINYSRCICVALSIAIFYFSCVSRISKL